MICPRPRPVMEVSHVNEGRGKNWTDVLAMTKGAEPAGNRTARHRWTSRASKNRELQDQLRKSVTGTETAGSFTSTG